MGEEPSAKLVYPTAKKGLRRLDALPAFGPPIELDTIESSRRKVMETELADKLLMLELPDPPQGFTTRLFAAFDATLQTWFEDFVAAGFTTVGLRSLGNRFLEVFDEGPTFERWSEKAFLDWNEQYCGLRLAEFEDGEAEWIVEAEIAQLLVDLPRHSLLARVHFLQRCLATPQPTSNLLGHRPVRKDGGNRQERQRTQHTIRTAFEEQGHWQSVLESVEWTALTEREALPSIRSLSPRPHFLMVHLFSGRRREGDVHHWLNQWANEQNVMVTILSMDTAVSSYYGNLCVESCSWQKVAALFEAGVVSGGIAGSPCETFSAARNQRPEADSKGVIPKWPRPLRTASRPYGLAGLTSKEYRQLKQGSAFFLQTTLLATWQLVHGGRFLSEHPAPPPFGELGS